MISIGILGGTFNPIHNGHLKIAEAAYKQFSLSEVWFMPNHVPVYKNNNDIVDGKIRYEMVQLAIRDIPYFKASDFELQRDGNTYTAETMEALGRLYPEIHFYFIIGEDSLNYFEKWKKPEVILAYTDILVAPRGNSSVEKMNIQIDKLHFLFGENHFYRIECMPFECSSSEIRKQIYTNKNNREFLDNWALNYMNFEVYSYILNHKLYGLSETL